MATNVKGISGIIDGNRAIKLDNNYKFKITMDAAKIMRVKGISIFFMDNASTGTSNRNVPLTCLATTREIDAGNEPKWADIKGKPMTRPAVDPVFVEQLFPKTNTKMPKSSELSSKEFVFRVSSEAFATAKLFLRIYQYDEKKYVLCTDKEFQECEKSKGNPNFESVKSGAEDVYDCMKFMNLRKVKFVNDSLYGEPTEKLNEAELKEMGG